MSMCKEGRLKTREIEIGLGEGTKILGRTKTSGPGRRKGLHANGDMHVITPIGSKPFISNG